MSGISLERAFGVPESRPGERWKLQRWSMFPESLRYFSRWLLKCSFAIRCVYPRRTLVNTREFFNKEQHCRILHVWYCTLAIFLLHRFDQIRSLQSHLHRNPLQTDNSVDNKIGKDRKSHARTYWKFGGFEGSSPEGAPDFLEVASVVRE